MKANTIERFNSLQSAWRDAANAVRAHQINLSVKYGGQTHYASNPEKKRAEQLHARERKACDRFVAFLKLISPRDWCSGVACAWLRDSLTFEDAITTGALSGTPTPGYGFTERDLTAFVAGADARVI